MCPQTTTQLESLIVHDGFNPFLGNPVPVNSESLNLYINQVLESSEKETGKLFTINKENELVGALFLEPLAFDSKLYGFPMAKISFLAARGDYDEEKRSKNHLIQQAFEYVHAKGIKHLSVRALPDQMAHIHALEENGFYLVAGLSSFLLDLKKRQQAGVNPAVKVRPFEEADLGPLSDLSRKSFGNPKDWLDKAHADPNLPKELSDELYVRWFQNCCSGEQADQVLVAEAEGKAVGYIALKLEKGIVSDLGWRIGSVPLNAVSPDFRKMGIYSTLVHAGLDWFSDKVDWVTIKTQVTTLAVHRTWLKLGAQMTSVEYAFHRFFK